MAYLAEIKRKLATGEQRIALLEKSYQAILEFIDKIEQLFQFQDKVDLSHANAQLWPVFLSEIRSLITVDVCALFLVDEEDQEFHLRSVLPEDQGVVCEKEIAYQIECGVFSWIINRRKPAIIPSFVFKEKKTIIMLPLSTLKRTMGMVLILTPIEESAITQENLKLLTLLCKQYSLMMENTLLYENLRQENEYLQEAQDQIVQSEKLASLGRLTAGAFHEILNPLNIISSHIQFLSMDKAISPRVSKYMTVMQTQTERIAKIVKGFLLFTGQSHSEKKQVHVNRILEKVIALVEFGMSLEKIEILKDFDAHLPSIMGDEEKLSQVFFNLLSNARDAMPDGGKLRVTTGVSSNHAGLRGKGDLVEIMFQDSGCGIPSDNLSNIFDPFFTTMQGGESRGLGLSASYGIIKEHGGSISVESELNEGTTFTVSLPPGA